MSFTKSALQLPLEIEVIKEMLPHKYPFLLLDRVVELRPGESGKAIKNVTINEPFFQGHFPGESIMPGVLLVETMAQLIAVIYVSKAYEDDNVGKNSENLSDKVGYLVGIKNMKFMKKVVPGDQLLVYARITGMLGALSQVKVWCEINDKKVVEGMLTVSERE